MHLWWQMEFSVSSKAFIHTPGTRSDMTAIIQVGLLLVVWHEFHCTFMLTRFHFGRGFYLAFFYFHYYTRVFFKFWISVEWKESNKHKQLRNIREKELVLPYSISCCWWCYCFYCHHGHTLSKASKCILLFGKHCSPPFREKSLEGMHWAMHLLVNTHYLIWHP